jgi:hypothetical protein
MIKALIVDYAHTQTVSFESNRVHISCGSCNSKYRLEVLAEILVDNIFFILEVLQLLLVYIAKEKCITQKIENEYSHAIPTMPIRHHLGHEIVEIIKFCFFFA